MSTIEIIQGEFAQARRLLDSFCADPATWEKIAAAGDLIVSTLRSGGKVIACGNGGSYCDAMHFAEELSGRYRCNRPALAAIAASDGAHITCAANDFGYDEIYARFIESVGRPEDLVMLFTSSGNSKNLLRAAEQAHSQGIAVLGLTGRTGGPLAPLCDVEVRVPWEGYADRVQEIHIKIVHTLLHYVEIEMGFTPKE